MIKKKLTIKNKTGLHARPAAIFIKEADKYNSNIRIKFSNREINAKSIISLINLGLEKGKEITLKVDGRDEKKALQELSYLINEKLPEEDNK